MKQGFPYRGTEDNPGAHDLAPKAAPRNGEDVYGHWSNYPGWRDLL